MRSRWMARALCCVGVLIALALSLHSGLVQEPPGRSSMPRGPGWRALGENDFARVNGNPDTWTWRNGVLFCSGKPMGVIAHSKG